MSRLTSLRRRGYTAFQLALLAKQTGDSFFMLAADAQAVSERLAKAPKRPTQPRPVELIADAEVPLTLRGHP